MRNRWTFTFAAAAALWAGAGCSSWTPDWQWDWPWAAKPKAVDIYVHGQLLAEQGDANAALAELAEALRLDPNLSVAHEAMGDIYRKQGNLDHARDSYEAACKTDPYAFRPHYNLAITYQALSHTAKALVRAEEYLREAVRIYLRAVAIEPKDYDTNLNLSACYFQLGKFDLAEQYALEAAKIDPRNPFVHGNLGLIYDRQSRPFDAIREYKISLELDSNQTPVISNLGAIYIRDGRYKSAIALFERAAQVEPNFAFAHEQLGTCYFQLRQYDDAASAFQKAAGIDPLSSAAFRGIGVTRMAQYLADRSRAELREEALEAWDRSLELQPNQPEVLRLVQKYRPRPSAAGS